MPRHFHFWSRARLVGSVGRRLAIALLLTTAALAARIASAETVTIRIDDQASSLERFAARELQRYVYLRTGELAAIRAESASHDAGTTITVAAQQRTLARTAGIDRSLAPQDFQLQTTAGANGAAQLAIIGGDPVGTLYGVYRAAEKLGVRFYLHGDVVPDMRMALDVAGWNESGHALFSVRGLLPFHDFAEGPDWWSADDYLAVIGQLAKLRMNFIGLHTYPDSDVGPEPTVWIGIAGDYDERGQVRTAYPASYHTTSRSGRSWWTYAPTRTSDFVGGAGDLFDRDDYGAEVMRGRSFESQTPASAAEVFNGTAKMLATAFAEARRLGVLTCIGTETPLTLPAALKDELARAGKHPTDPGLTRAAYRAMFDRIGRVTPADFFWLWTPENWTWAGNRSDEFATTAADIQAAAEALRELKSPMRLATCGWVLGPQHDRSALDRLLPADAPMSAINSSVGHVAIERQFANLSNRPRWAIPWLENDGTLTSPQLWAGRMRFDAADARRLGCTGLIGIHWRTRVLAPQISALAAAGWDQSWVPDSFDVQRIPPLTASGADGGHPVRADGPIADSDESAMFETNRVGMRAYDLLVPNGTYQLRFGFCELEQAAPGARIFDVKVNGTVVVDRLDIAARVGTKRATTIALDRIHPVDGRLLIEFTPHAGEPAIASLAIEGVTEFAHASLVRRINCGGPAVGGYEADELPGQPRPPIERTMPVVDFYRDFAMANFGAEAGPVIARVFADIDGVALPMPTLWIDGPGDIRRNPVPWAAEAQKYAFVDRLVALRDQVRGSANRVRYDYWLNEFRAMRLIAEIGCTAGALDQMMVSIAAVTDPASARTRARSEALPLRTQLATLWTELIRTEVAAVSNVGELGTLANLEQRSRVHQRILSRHDDALVKLLGCDLPIATSPEPGYAGEARIVVPTVRTAAAAGERLTASVLLLAERDASEGVLCWRWLGEGRYRREPLRHVARRGYQFELPALSEAHPSLEYHVEAKLDDATHRWPISDHGMDQTVVLAE